MKARDRIMEATFALITAEGVSAVTNRRVAKAASISLGSLTYHFTSQQELLRETLERYLQEEVERITSVAIGLQNRQLGPEELGIEIQQLAALSSNRLELAAEMEIHLLAARDPDLQSASRSCFEAYEAFAAAALDALKVPEPDRHAPHVVNLMMGIGLKQLGTGERDAAGLADSLQTLTRGAGARAEAGRPGDTGGDERSG